MQGRSEYDYKGGVAAVEVLCPLKDGDFDDAIGLSGCLTRGKTARLYRKNFRI